MNVNIYLALPVGPYVELEMIRDMIPQIEPLPIAIPIAAPIAIPSKYHKNSQKKYLRNPYAQSHIFSNAKSRRRYVDVTDSPIVTTSVRRGKYKYHRT